MGDASLLAAGGAIVATVALMYLGRAPAHGAIAALCAAFRKTVQAVADVLSAAAERLTARNRRVMLELGRQQTERRIELEFARIGEIVSNDLAGYPALHRKISDQIARVERDHRASIECPPAPTEWVKAVKAIADVPAREDSAVGRILGEIQETLETAQAEAMDEYRAASRKRHRLLHRMMPFWRALDRTLGRVERTITGLGQHAEAIDREMETYREIRADADDAVARLSASTFTSFLGSGLVLLIALLGGFVNFHLIALPMSEMVGAGSYVGPLRTSDVAALVLILTEVAMGVFLMESLRITRLFPVIGVLDDRMRRRLAWVAFALLLSLASVESSLAYMRDLLAADREALTRTLVGAAAAPAEFRFIPALGQMVLGFVLPFALMFAAIPLESFIHALRMVGGTAVVSGIRASAGGAGLAAQMSQHLEALLVSLYDLAIVVPIGIENLVRSGTTRGRPPADGEAVAARAPGVVS